MIRLGMTYSSSTPLDYELKGECRTIKVKFGDEEKEYCVLSVNISNPFYPGEYGFSFCRGNNIKLYTYELEEIQKVKVKTKEQIAAEESVAKAKEALKAAENALKVVKEGK